MAINESINLVKKIYGLKAIYVLLVKDEIDNDTGKGIVDIMETEDDCKCVNLFTSLEFARKYLDDTYENVFEIYPITKIDKKQYDSFFYELVDWGIDYINVNCTMNIDSIGCETSWFIKVNKIKKKKMNVLENLYFNTGVVNEESKKRQIEVLNQIFEAEYKSKIEKEQTLNENCFVYHMILSTMIPNAKKKNPEHVFYFKEVLKFLQIVIWNKLKELNEFYIIVDEDKNIEIMNEAITVVYTDKLKKNSILLNVHELKELLAENRIKEVYVTDGEGYSGKIKASNIIRDKSEACERLLRVFPNLNTTVYIIGNKEKEHVYIDDCIRIFNTNKDCLNYIKQMNNSDDYSVYQAQLIEILEEIIKECHEQLYIYGFDKTMFSVDLEDLLSIKDFIRSFAVLNDTANGKITNNEAYELLKNERIYLIGDIETIHDYVVKVSTLNRETEDGKKYNSIRCFVMKETAEKYNGYNFSLTHIKLEDLLEMCNGKYAVILEPHQNCWIEFGVESLSKNTAPNLDIDYFYPVSEYIFENIDLVKKEYNLTELIKNLETNVLQELKRNAKIYKLKNILLEKYLSKNDYTTFTDSNKKIISILGEECILNRKLKNKDNNLVLHVDFDDFNLFPNLILLNLIGIIYFYTDKDRILSVKLHVEKDKLPIVNKYKEEINAIMKEIEFLDTIAVILKK